MNYLAVCIFLLVGFSAYAEDIRFDDPLYSSSEVLAALYEQAQINPKDAKVIIFEYNYIKKVWHIELTPTKQACIDCYPSFYFENAEKLILKKIPHG